MIFENEACFIIKSSLLKKTAEGLSIRREITNKTYALRIRKKTEFCIIINILRL